MQKTDYFLMQGTLSLAVSLHEYLEVFRKFTEDNTKDFPPK